MIIGIAGRKFTGKTTAANFIEDMYEIPHFAFANPVKDVCKYIFRLTDEQLNDPVLKETVIQRWGKTPRDLMIMVGQMVRDVDKDGWIKKTHEVTSEYDKFIISDCRFRNEAEYIKNRGGIIIGIVRNNVAMSEDESETSVDEFWEDMVDYTIFNTGNSKRELYEKVEQIIDKHFNENF